MSKKIFIHEYKLENRINEEKQLDEEYLRDGIKGISFKSLKLSKGKKEHFLKLSGKELEDGTFGVTIKKDGDEKKETLNKKDFIAFLKKHKELSFVVKYIEKDMEKFRKTLKGGKRRSSKKGSKKVYKKKSRKSSKKKSRKSSKKKSRKSSKKKSRKSSKKKSRKSSKKKARK